MVTNLPANAGGTRDSGPISGLGRSPGAGNSNLLQILAWRIPWAEEPGGPQSVGLQRVRHNWVTEYAHACTKNTTERNSRSSPCRRSPTRTYRVKGMFVVLLQSLSHVRLFATPGTAVCQASCPPLSPGVSSNSCPLSWWCHPTIASSVACFSSCPQTFPASGSFPMSWLFASGNTLLFESM